MPNRSLLKNLVEYVKTQADSHIKYINSHSTKTNQTIENTCPENTLEFKMNLLLGLFILTSHTSHTLQSPNKLGVY